MALQSFFALLLSAHIAAAAGPTPAPAAGAASTQTYSLRNLHPVGLLHQNTASEKKQLLQFSNEQGSQNLIYEESNIAAPVREIGALLPFMASTSHLCSVELECKTKAFCTNECKSLYYEVSNLSAEKAAPGRNFCTIKSFSCTQERATASVMPIPEATLPLPVITPAKSP